MFPTKNNNNLFLNNQQSTTSFTSSPTFYNLPSTSNQFSNLTNNTNQIPQQNLNYSFCIYPYFNYNNNYNYNYYSSNNLQQQQQQLNNNNLLFNNQSSKINYNSLAIKSEINPVSNLLPQIAESTTSNLNTNSYISNNYFENKIFFKKENEDLKKGKKRILFSQQQIQILEDAYRASSFINQAIRNELAKRCGLRADQVVKIWFQNRRYKQKKKKKDKEFLENQQKQNSNLKIELNNENKELSFPPTTYCFNTNYYSDLNEDEQLPFLN
uniref:Homeobox domain-containing protein n=1 Tax=Meloidogyne enterolobii TaxID=390850 RepID=A0A6V7VLA0_MELEN|nr:unnamed protein product [Meloidogyne enterolobii]